VNFFTRLTADQNRAVTPIPERLAALESWILAENFDTKHGIPYALSLEKICSERVRYLGKDIHIVGRTLFFLFAGLNTFSAFFTREKGRIKHFAADFIFWV